jgi:hypothetical protein
MLSTWMRGAASQPPTKKRTRRRPPALATRDHQESGSVNSTPNYCYAIEDPFAKLKSYRSFTADHDASREETWSMDGRPSGEDRPSNPALYFFVDDGVDVAELWLLGREDHVAETRCREACDLEPQSLELEPREGKLEVANDEVRTCEGDSRLDVEGVKLEVVEGSTFNRNVASFAAPHGLGESSRFAATIDWGDGSTNRGTILNDGSRFRVSGSHAYANCGVYSVTVRILGDGTLESEATSAITVHDAGFHAVGHFTRAAVGREFNGVVALFRDQNRFGEPDGFTARIDWGDGTISPGTIAANLDGGYDILGTHTFLAAGNYPAEVRITSHGGNTALARTSIRVDEVCIAARGLTAVTVVGSESKLTVAAFEDSDRRASPEFYSANIDWADGLISDAIIAPSPSGGYRVIGEHCYRQVGLFSVRVTIRDHAGHRAATIGTVRVIS